MQLKPDVRIHGIKNELTVGLLIAESVFRARNFDLTITSVIDGTHSHGSLHYSGMAVDIRRPTSDEIQSQHLRDALKIALGPDFDVVLEPTHVHLEFQPKRPY